MSEKERERERGEGEREVQSGSERGGRKGGSEERYSRKKRGRER